MSYSKGNAVAAVIRGTPAKPRVFNTRPIQSPQYVGTLISNWMIGIQSASGPNPNDWFFNGNEVELGNNDVPVTAPGCKGWLRADITRRIVGVRANKTPQATVKASWKLHEVVTPKAVKAWIDRRDLYHRYEPIYSITAPVNGAFTAPGAKVTVTLAIIQDDCFSASSQSWTVAVEKDTPVLQWSIAVPLVVAGTKLSRDHLNATTQFENFGADKPPIAYDHPLHEVLADAKPVSITASVAESALFKAAAPKSVTLKVVADLTALGTEAMGSGQAFKRPQSGAKKAVLDRWDSDNTPSGIKATSRKVLSDVKGMTGDEIEEYMDKFINPEGKPAAGTRTPPGPTQPYPDPSGKVVNVIWELPNGMQVRLKPHGDDAAVQGPPMFCIEGKTCVGPSTSKNQVAFKVTSDGNPGAYGPKETLLPPGLASDKNDLGNKAYMDAACDTTHLKAKAKSAQTITWGNPPDITAGDPLGPQSLNAKADDPASLRYTDSADQPVTPATVLQAGQGQVLKVTSVATKRYLATDVPITATINVVKKVDAAAKPEQPK